MLKRKKCHFDPSIKGLPALSSVFEVSLPGSGIGLVEMLFKLGLRMQIEFRMFVRVCKIHGK